jgi:hypothetical protein
VTSVREGRGAYQNFVGRPERKRTHGRRKCRWEDNIIMSFKTKDGDMDWSDQA